MISSYYKDPLLFYLLFFFDLFLESLYLIPEILFENHILQVANLNIQYQIWVMGSVYTLIDNT